MGQGQRKKQMLTATHQGVEIRVPWIEIVGASDGPTLAVVAGIHGAEYAGIEATLRLSQQILPEALRGRLRIVPVCNLPGFLGRSEAICPVDGKNLNRVFPGDPQGSYSDRLAHLVFSQVVEGADCVLNIHGGDIFEALVPYVGIGSSGNPKIDETCRTLGRIYDLPFLVEFASLPDPSSGQSLNRAAQTKGIPSILAEAGGEGTLDEASVMIHLKGLTNVLKWMKMIEGEPQREVETKELTSDFWRIHEEGFIYPTARLGQHVKEGQEIGILKNWFGEVIEILRAPREAYILAIVTTPAARKNAIVYQVAY